jgi:hypothetical protein
VVGFADDLSIATSHKDPLVATKNLQIVCDHIGAWLESRKLQLYGGKTVFMIFARRSSSGSSEPLNVAILRKTWASKSIFVCGLSHNQIGNPLPKRDSL